MCIHKQMAKARGWERSFLTFGLITRAVGEGQFFTWKGVCDKMIKCGYKQYSYKQEE